MITKDQFRACGFSSAITERWYEPFTEAFSMYMVYTPLRMAHTLSQVGHESVGLAVTVENLNYSGSALFKTFRKYFPTQGLANSYARQPERIANRVYANRMGNGPESSGDGWRYRGAGPIQLTGFDNQKAAATYMGIELPKLSNLLINDAGIGSQGSMWFLWTNKCQAAMDDDDVLGLSKMINVGSRTSKTTPNGMDDRIARLKKCKAALGL